MFVFGSFLILSHALSTISYLFDNLRLNLAFRAVQTNLVNETNAIKRYIMLNRTSHERFVEIVFILLEICFLHILNIFK